MDREGGREGYLQQLVRVGPRAWVLLEGEGNEVLEVLRPLRGLLEVGDTLRCDQEQGLGGEEGVGERVELQGDATAK